MSISRILRTAGLTLAVAAVAAPHALASDHLDAPLLTSPGGDGRLDIADLYAFQSPTDASRAVIIVTVNPAAGVLSPVDFDPETSYDIRIDDDGDAREDLVFKIDFGTVQGDGSQELRVRAVPAQGGGAVLGSGSTDSTITLNNGGLARAGLFDDPFFFDLDAFLGNAGRSFCDGGEVDFFAGLNVSAIVLELDRSFLGGDSIGIWATTTRQAQVDRVGRPAINTVFIPSDVKDLYNESKPRHDARRFSEYLVPFDGVLLPDVLTIDTSSTAGFLNGRLLDDDVIDIELQVITGDPSASDCVPANDVPFSGGFPYLGTAH